MVETAEKGSSSVQALALSLASCACFSPAAAEQTVSPQSVAVAIPPAPTTYKMESLLLIVTGASKGLGKAITNHFCLRATESILQLARLHVILAARSSGHLEEIGRNILRHHQREDPHKKTQVNLSCHTTDLADLDQLDNHFDRMFQEVDLASFDRVVFVNNAGSLGFLGPCAASPSLADMRSTVDLNITGALWLSSRFARLVQESNTTARGGVTLVNISSLLAVQSFPTMGIYGATKAARDHFHATMAQEIPPQRLKILNYAPGPLETDMVAELRSAPHLEPGLKAAFDPKQIEPEESARKLVELILSNDFKSGQHVDYYDLKDKPVQDVEKDRSEFTI